MTATLATKAGGGPRTIDVQSVAFSFLSSRAPSTSHPLDIYGAVVYETVVHDVYIRSSATIQTNVQSLAWSGDTNSPTVDIAPRDLNVGSVQASSSGSSSPEIEPSGVSIVRLTNDNVPTWTGSSGDVTIDGGGAVFVDVECVQFSIGTSDPLESFPGAKPAGQFYPWTQGVGLPAIDPFSTCAALAAIVPVSEPLSGGVPPSRPVLVASLTTGLAKRGARTVSGHPVVSPSRTRPRPQFEVRWPALSKSERDELRTFLRDDVGQGVRGITIEVDGPSTGKRNLRPLVDVTEQLIAKGVYNTVSVVCEELFA